MTNSTLRARRGISEPNKAMASRIISDAINDGLIRPEDPQQREKYAKRCSRNCLIIPPLPLELETARLIDWSTMARETFAALPASFTEYKSQS